MTPCSSVWNRGQTPMCAGPPCLPSAPNTYTCVWMEKTETAPACRALLRQPAHAGAAADGAHAACPAAASSCTRPSRCSPTRAAWANGWSTGHARPRTPPPLPSQRQGGWRRLNWAALRQQVGGVAQGLLDLKLPAGQPIAILSDNSLDHLVLVLAGMHIGRAVCTISSGYCRLAQDDYSRIHGILQTLDPCLVYASDADIYGPPLVWAGISAVEVFSSGAETPGRCGAIRQAGRHARDTRRDAGLCRHHPRHPRQVPAHQRQHRPPQGGDQHPPHAVRQPADAGADTALPGAGKARAAGLAALEPHLRRQPQREPGAAQRRHAVHRRRPPLPGAIDKHHRPPARGAAHGVLQRAARLRNDAAHAGEGRRTGAPLLRPPAHGVLRRRRHAGVDLAAAGRGRAACA
jgi:hypothetical protein